MSNIIVRVRYKKDVNFQKLVGGWVKYVSKDGADGISLKDTNSYDELLKKEFNLFDNTEDIDSNYIWNKYGDIDKNEIIKNLPKNQKGKMWNLVISFPPEFSFESGLKTKNDYYLLTKSLMPKFILDNNLDLTNTLWYASLHKDTDNPHLHICIFEKVQTRPKDTLEKSAIKRLKSNIASYLIDNSAFYKDQDFLLLGLENKIRQNNLTKVKNGLFFSEKYRKQLNKDLLSLYQKLPRKGRLQYNAKNLNYCRNDINKIIDDILYHDTIKYEFEKYYHNLEEIEKKQKRLYGESSNNQYVKNKIDKLYSKIGNEILHNYKVYNSTTFIDYQKEFLKVNIKNMNFQSRNCVKKSTIIKHSKELYQLAKLSGLSNSETKGLLKKWANNSKINYDIDVLFESASNDFKELSVTDFYKSLSHLGYSKERYDNYKNKSFYKSIKFKQFIHKANNILIQENKKEEKYLLEILEKELQGKDI